MKPASYYMEGLDPEDFICHIKGDFKGKKLKAIPSWYLKWLAENCYNDKLATAADRVYQWREENQYHID